MTLQHNILTAHEFIAQGTRAYQIVSMAGSSPARRELLDIAHTVASLTGDSMQIPGAVTQAREAARRAANDNRRRSRRAA